MNPPNYLFGIKFRRKSVHLFVLYKVFRLIDFRIISPLKHLGGNFSISSDVTLIFSR
jgi:hypothetical protein